MAEDPLLEPTQLRRGLDSELVGEQCSSHSVPVESLGVTSGAVEGDHQLTPAALTERLPRDQRLDLADHLDVAPERQLGVDDVLLDGLTERLPAPHVTVGEAFPGDVGHRRAAPQHQRRAQYRDGSLGVAGRQLGTAAGDELLEAIDVELARGIVNAYPRAGR